MPRTARRYDFYLPLTYNDGSPITDEMFESVERRLVGRFRGLTSQQREFPLKGIWLAEAQLFLDQVIIMTVLDIRPRGSTKFVGDLKKQLLDDFDQLEILITESQLRVH